MINDFAKWYDERFEKHFKEYIELLSFQSIATDPKFSKEVFRCANWVEHTMKSIGLEVERWEENGHPPTLFGKNLRAGPSAETLLFYCHYDVQPVDPLNLWTTPPFEPTLRDGEVYARGASDNKGQLFYTLLAIKGFLEKNKKFDFNLKFLVEGQEESGSTLLHKLLRKKKEALKSDFLVIVDSGFEEIERPSIAIGARGLVCMGLTLQEASFDLHSGMLGGIAYNPNRALVQLLSKLHDSKGKVAIPGFYEGIETLDHKTQEKLDFFFDEKKFKKAYGFLPATANPCQASWLEPTLEINGISGGYAGEGFKTVIPAKSSCKISCRLVKGQDPKRIFSLVSNFLKANVHQSMKLTIEEIGEGAAAFLSHPETKVVKVFQEAYSRVFKKPIGLTMMGGSIPIAEQMAQTSEAEIVLIGLGLGTDQIHAPNEHFGIDRLKLGFLTLIEAFNSYKK